MKVKNITVGIKSVRESLNEFGRIIKGIKHGHNPKKKSAVYFVSLEAMRRVLTPKRLGLLHTIREKHPRSIYELAHISRRALRNVQDDVKMLERVGLVSLNIKTKVRERIIPRVEYDQLQLQIPVV